MNAINQTLDQYINQLQLLLKNTETLQKTPDPNQRLGEDLVTKGIGVIAEELFESVTAGKIGQKWASNKIKQENKRKQEEVLANQEYYFKSILGQIRNFLITISIEKSNLKIVGNSNLLLKKFTSIETYVKLETKIRRVITVLNQIKIESLIYNSEISKIIKQEKRIIQKESYEILKELEQKLRQCISENLSKVSKEWWKRKVPEDVRKNAETRKKKNESPWLWIKGGSPLIDYIDFSDYGKIITRKDNWNEIFKHIFENRENLLSKLKELEPIRNTIMHSRNLTKKQVKRLELYSDDLDEKMKNQL